MSEAEEAPEGVVDEIKEMATLFAHLFKNVRSGSYKNYRLAEICRKHKINSAKMAAYLNIVVQAGFFVKKRAQLSKSKKKI
jgi:hypothetical protein